MESFRALRERLNDPGQRAEAVHEYRAAVERLRDQARGLALPLHHKAYELGMSPEDAAGVEQRLADLELAASAAEFIGQESAAARAEHERAGLLLEEGRLDEARTQLRRTLARHPDEDSARPYVQATLAEVERQLGDCAAALELAEELVRELAPRLEQDPGWNELAAEVERCRDYAYIDLGMPDLAWSGIHSRWERCESLARQGGGTLEELREARIAVLHLLRAVGDDERVVELVGRFLADDAPAAERARLLVLAGASELGGASHADPERARERLRQALALGLDESNRLFAHLELAESALRERELERAGAELLAARAALEAGGPALRGGHEAARLVTLEARHGLERGAPPAELERLRRALEDALVRLEEQWLRAPEREGGVGYLLYGRRRELVGEYARIALALEGVEAGTRTAFARVLALQELGTLARRAGALAVDVDTIRAELLAPGHGVLVYLPTSSHSHVFALDQDGLVHAQLASSRTLEPLRLAYLSHLVAGHAGLSDSAQRPGLVARERELARALADELLPVAVRARMAAWSAVTLVGSDVLGSLPFEWLPLGEHPYLGARLALDYLPSLPLGVAWSRRPQRAFACDYLLVGGAEPDARVQERWPELAPLPLTDELEQELTAPLAGRPRRVASCAAATRATLLAPDLAAVRVLQFLVHGVQEHEREHALALVLTPANGDDGLFRWSDAAAARAPAFVLLTGCLTGTGPTRKGDPGIGDMGGAWLAAGAQAVLLSSSELALSRVRSLSTRFLGRLVEPGMTPARALQEERATLLEEHGKCAPFEDGLLRVVGLGQRPVFEDAPAPRAPDYPEWAWLLGVVLALSAGLVLGLRLRRAPRAA
jgi:CHAT domain-containing protein